MSDHNGDPLAELEESAEPDAAPAWDPALSEPVRKGGLPRWIWAGCGFGCLLIFLLVVAIAIGGYSVLKDSENPDVQWANLREHLHFEDRPEDLILEFGVRVPEVPFLVSVLPSSEQYMLRDSEDGYTVSVRVLSSDAEIAVYMDPGFSLPGGIAVSGGEEFVLELQGREVDAMRFESSDTDIPLLSKDQEALLDQGHGLRALIARDSHSVLVELRSGPGGKAVSDAQVADFFDHFDLWR